LKDEKLVVAYLRRNNKAEVLPKCENIEKNSRWFNRWFWSSTCWYWYRKKAVLFYEKIFEATRES